MINTDKLCLLIVRPATADQHYSIAHSVYVNCVVEILIIWSDPKIKSNVNELAHGK